MYVTYDKIYSGRNGVFIGVYVNIKNEDLPILRLPTKEQELVDNDIIDVEGFFYWSEDDGPFPAITEIQVRLQ